ncbi:MAG: hypothetical protein M3N43_07075, partial [Actinomycetota bacterium]|nr:hypothetical protein [Actinomycetota bacterium]
MSPDAASTASIPAQVTVEELALALDREMNEVQAALTARGDPASPDDVVAADLALEVAKALGVPLKIEARDLALETLYQLEIGGE